jgi:hypothetical protein
MNVNIPLLLLNSEQLIGTTTASPLIQNRRVLSRVINKTNLVVAIEWSEKQRIPSSIRELLRVGDLTGAISSAATGEYLHCCAGCTAGIETYAPLCLYQILALLSHVT